MKLLHQMLALFTDAPSKLVEEDDSRVGEDKLICQGGGNKLICMYA